jgi:TPR repeat protein
MSNPIRRIFGALCVCLALTPLLASSQGTEKFNALLAKAEAGDVSAQFAVGFMYDAGLEVAKSGPEATRWYQRAADGGHSGAQNSLGSMLQAEKRYGEALAWYQRAAAQNHAQATSNLAYLYDLGLGVPQDRNRAGNLYVAAANLGWAEAMWNLAIMQSIGQLGPVDLVTACAWTVRARRYADPTQKVLVSRIDQMLPKLERTLSRAQYDECRQRGDGWSPASPSQMMKTP